MNADELNAELIKTNVGDALKETLTKRHPDKKFAVLPEGSAVTMDFNPDRYRVYYNKWGVITRITNG